MGPWGYRVEKKTVAPAPRRLTIRGVMLFFTIVWILDKLTGGTIPW
jgi:hypothetical protein